jgi:hypothetical protein
VILKFTNPEKAMLTMCSKVLRDWFSLVQPQFQAAEFSWGCKT